MPISHADIPTYGKILGTAITDTYQTVLAVTDDVIILHVLNTCDEPIIISLNGGVTSQYESDGESFTIDFQAGSLRLKAPTIQVKHAGAAPTAGSLRITAIRTGVTRNVL